MSTKPTSTTPPAVGSRQADFLAKLGGAGSSIADLSLAMNWQPHSVRAALSGLRKRGLTVERIEPKEGGAALYRVKPAKGAKQRAKA